MSDPPVPIIVASPSPLVVIERPTTPILAVRSVGLPGAPGLPGEPGPPGSGVVGTLSLLDYVTGSGADEAAGLNEAFADARAGNLLLTAPPGLIVGIASQVILANNDTLYFSSEACTIRILPTFDWSTVPIQGGAVHAKSNPDPFTLQVKGLRIDGNGRTNSAVPESKAALSLAGAYLSLWQRGYVGSVNQSPGSNAVWLLNCNTLTGDLRVEDNGGDLATSTGMKIEGGSFLGLDLSVARQINGINLHLVPQSKESNWNLTGFVDEPSNPGFRSVVVEPPTNISVDINLRGMLVYGATTAAAVEIVRGSHINLVDCTIGPYVNSINGSGLRVVAGAITLSKSRLHRTGTGNALVVLPGAAVDDAGGNIVDNFVGNGTFQSKMRQNQYGTGAVITGHTSAVVVWDPPAVATGAVTSTTITVVGARAGDVATAGMEVALPAGMLISAAVTARDTVTVTLANLTGGAVNLASGDLRVDLWQHANLFSPYLIESYVQGFAADTITGLANNDPVVTWVADKGTNAITPGGAGTQPLYITNWQNGLPCVRADGVNDWMEFSPYSFPDAFTMFIVGKKNSGASAAARRLVAQRSDTVASSPTPGHFHWAASGIPRAFFQDDAALILTAADTVVRSGNVELWTIQKIPDNGAGDTLTLYRNGVQVGTQQSSRGIPTGANRTTLFAGFGPAIGQWIDYDLGELIICNANLDLTTRQSAEAFFIDKWKIT